MANGNSKILTADQEKQLRQPIGDYVGQTRSFPSKARLTV